MTKWVTTSFGWRLSTPSFRVSLHEKHDRYPIGYSILCEQLGIPLSKLPKVATENEAKRRAIDLCKLRIEGFVEDIETIS